MPRRRSGCLFNRRIHPTLTPFGIFQPQTSETSLYFTNTKVSSDFMVDCVEHWLEQKAELLKDIRKLVLDLAGVDYVSSAGLRVFLFTAKKIHRSGGHLGLVAPRDLVKNVFVMAALDSMFSFFGSQDEAVKALG